MKLDTVEDILNAAIMRDTQNYKVTWKRYKKTVEKYQAAGESIERNYFNGLITYDESVRCALDIYTGGLKK